MMSAVLFMIAMSAGASFSTPITYLQDICILFDRFELSSYCQDIDPDPVHILKSLYNQERTLSQCIMGLIIHQTVYLAETMENTYYRVKHTSHLNENLLYQE